MTKSSGELQRHLAWFSLGHNHRLDEFRGGAFSVEDGGREASMTLGLPEEKCTHPSEAELPKFTIKNI